MPESLIHFPFRAGIDEKTASLVLEPGPFLQLQSLVQDKTGSVQKTAGFTALTNLLLDGSTTITAAKKLVSFVDELALIDGHKLYTYSPTANAWRYEDQVPEASVDRKPVVQLGSPARNYDVTYVNGYFVVAWSCAVGASSVTTPFTAVIDAANGAVVIPPTPAAGAVDCSFSLVVLGNVVFYVFFEGGSTDIVAGRLDCSSAATINAGWGPASGVTISDAEGPFDVVALTDRFVIAYVNTSGGGNSITVHSYNAAGASIQSAAIAIGGLTSAVAIGGIQTDVLWVAYATPAGTSVSAVGLSPANLTTTLCFSGTVLPAVAAPQSIGVIRTGQGSALVVAGGETGIGSLSSAMYWRRFHVASTAIVNDGNVSKTFRLVPESRPFSDGARFYVMARYENTTIGGSFDASQNVLTCVDISQESGTARPVANINPRLSLAPTQYRGSPLTHFAQVSATKIVVLNQTKRSNVSAAIELVTLDFADSNQWRNCRLGDVQCLSGGVASYYDGTRVAEQGFLVYPDEIQTPTFSGGGLTGSFEWCAVYVQVDAKGQVHRSAPSPPAGPFSITSKQAAIAVNTLQLTSRTDAENSKTPVRIEIYRTTAGGSVFLLAGTIVNDTSASMVTLNDNVPDANLGAEMYTQPGASSAGQATSAPNVAPPSLSSLITHGDRLVGIEGQNAWFSKQAVVGEGPAWADLNQFPVSVGGNLSAVASLDGRMIFFKREPIIAYVDGDGPPDSGIGGDYSPPRYIATDVGCINQNSIVVTPLGIFFQSPRGLELLDRSMSVQPFFGRAVENTLNANPLITSAVLRPAEGRVIFTAVAFDGATDGVQIVYDLVHEAWYTRPLAAPIGAILTGPASAALIGSTSPVYHFVTSGGIVCREGGYFDGSNWITLLAETPDIHVAGLQGYQSISKVMLWANYLSPHDLHIDLAFDGGAYTEPHTFTAAQLAALDREELEVIVGNQTCQSIRVKIYDATPSSGGTSTGQGAQLIDLAFSVKVESGMARRQAAARA